MRVGNGTCLVNCEFCGQSMLDGALVKHWQSRECKRHRTSWLWMETFKDARRLVKKQSHRVVGI